MREFSVPPLVTVADRANLTDPVWANAASHPDTPQFAIQDDGRTLTITCARFRDEVASLARGLIAAGIGPGDRVGLLSRTRYEWTLIDYAIWSTGAVTVPIYESSSLEQLEWILTDSGAVACFVDTPARYDDVVSVRDRAPNLARIWSIDPAEDGARPGDLVELVAAGEAIPIDEVHARRRDRRADDLATIIYTSGTTGRPKGCMLTHRNIASDVSNAIAGLPNLFREGASTLLFLPLAHSFARLVQCGVVQGRVLTSFSPDVKQLVPDLRTTMPTFLLSVPRLFEKIYNTAKTQAHSDGKGVIFDRAEKVAIAFSEAMDTKSGPGPVLRLRHSLFDRLVYAKLRVALGGRCQAAISGGAPLGARLAHFFRGVGITVYEGYGLTETSPAAAVNLRDHIRIGTVGRPLPGVTIRIADDGEICVHGDLVFAGYWRNGEATAEVKDADGWLYTGDLGHLDGDGYLTVTGRKKELIVTAGGKNVAPAVLEDRVRAHPLVSQCMVVGDRQPFIAALVTLDEDALRHWTGGHGKHTEATAADLTEDAALRADVQQAIDDANRAVSTAESIRVFRILPGDFTEANGMLTPSLKVKRTVVAKEYADEIAAIYR